MGRHNPESPVRTRGSPHRRSPSRRERSPPRRMSSNADKLSSHNRSPKRPRSRSPEKPYIRTKSPKHRRSPSPVPNSPAGQKPSSRPKSPRRVKSRSPKRVNPRSSVSPSPEREKLSVRNRSLSPRSKRLQRVKAERDGERGSEREHERNHGRNGERATHKEKDFDRDLSIEKDRRSGRDATGNGSRSRHDRSASPSDRRHRGRRDEVTSSSDDDQRNGDDDSLAKMKAAEETLEAKEKQHKPSFELSGKLAAETNRYRGVTLLFNEAPDARKPDVRWRLYVFKGGEVLNEPLYVHRQSCYLFGRERRVADIPTDHPSCSKQHAVLQYRQVEEENPDGTMAKSVRPYLMDLGSTNGTFVNDTQIEPQRYYELFEKDTIKFGNSSREYVILHENSTS